MERIMNTGSGVAVTWLFAAIILLLWAPSTLQAQADLSDMEIVDAIQDEMQYDPAISPSTLDITASEGIITLDGRVTNLLAKERAERITETVKGVRSVINLITVSPPIPLRDEAIRQDVENALLADPATESYEVTASVDNGVVTLRGSVDSWNEKELAGNVAKGVRGVVELENEVDVDLSLIRDDEEIEREVEEVLRWDVLVDGALIEVEADNGRLELRGVVGSAAEKRRAVREAHVAGVASVDASELTVGRWARNEDIRSHTSLSVTDREISEAVETALLYDPRVLEVDITATAEEGIVTLRGEVGSLRAWRAAENLARNTFGVRLVDNRLKVRPEKPLTDARIEERVEEALARNPYVEAGEILVRVAGSIVKLTGTVDSSFEKATADNVASGIEGVVEVENYLEVPTIERPLVYDPYLDETDPRSLTWYRFRPFSPTSTDTEIQRAIELEFFWSPFVDGSDIHVEVEDGVATLTGTVDSVREREDAAKNAYEGGAVWVDNELIVVR